MKYLTNLQSKVMQHCCFNFTEPNPILSLVVVGSKHVVVVGVAVLVKVSGTLQEGIGARGYKAIFSPKFHCQLDSTEGWYKATWYSTPKSTATITLRSCVLEL